MKKISDTYSEIADKVASILGYIIGAWFFVLLVVLSWQIISRFAINASSSWTEELASYSLVWIVMIGIALGIHELSIPKVDIFTMKLPERARIRLEIFVNVLCCIFFIVLMVAGFRLSFKMMPQRLPALKISVIFFYLALPIGGTFDLFFSIDHILKDMVKLRKFPERSESV